MDVTWIVSFIYTKEPLESLHLHWIVCTIYILSTHQKSQIESAEVRKCDVTVIFCLPMIHF